MPTDEEIEAQAKRDVEQMIADAEITGHPEKLRNDLAKLLNENGWDTRCNTPDFILARMLVRTLLIYSMLQRERTNHETTEEQG